jgi:hypothetical protein
MTWKSNILLAIAASASVGADCGGCPKVQLPEPMTENRVRELDPSITEGIGLSTTWIHGDCRAVPQQPPKCNEETTPACFEGRVAMRVFLIPVNTAVPQSPECGEQFANSDLERLAALDVRTNDAGEVTAHVPAGRYSLYISQDDRCAVCGIADGGDACLIDVPRNGIAARDLVLDEAAH